MIYLFNEQNNNIYSFSTGLNGGTNVGKKLPMPEDYSPVRIMVQTDLCH